MSVLRNVLATLVSIVFGAALFLMIFGACLCASLDIGPSARILFWTTVVTANAASAIAAVALRRLLLTDNQNRCLSEKNSN
jgi:hypothetical protein